MRTAVFIVNVTLAIIILPLVLSIFSAAGFILIGEQLWAQEPWLSWVAQFVPVLALLVMYVFATLEPPKKFGLFWSKKLLWFSIGVGVAAGAALYIMDVVFDKFAEFTIPADPTLSVALGYVFALGILVPFTEELLFRGLIQTSLTERIKSDWAIHPAIWIAVGLEVVAHASGALLFADPGQGLVALWGRVPQLLYVFVFGAIGGWVYHRTQSLTGPFLIHALGNALELLLYWLAAA
jgi:membrane protease YdiL (CAAX protease family)